MECDASCVQHTVINVCDPWKISNHLRAQSNRRNVLIKKKKETSKRKKKAFQLNLYNSLGILRFMTFERFFLMNVEERNEIIKQSKCVIAMLVYGR